MAIARIRPILSVTYRVDICRCFYASPLLLTPAPGSSSTKRKVSRPIPQFLKQRKEPQRKVVAGLTEDDLPLNSLCKSAFESWLPIEPEKQLSMLRHYQVEAGKHVGGTKDWERALVDGKSAFSIRYLFILT